MNRSSVIVGLIVASLATTASAQTSFSIPSFSAASPISYVGSAVSVGTVARITDSTFNQTGAFWHQNQFPVAAGFDTTFTFRILPGPSVAEGIAFVIQNAPQGNNALGGTIWSLGYGTNVNGGIPNSIAIEIDTYADGFLGDIVREVSVHTRGTIANNDNESYSIGRYSHPSSLANNAIHTMRVNYVPGTLEVYVDNLTVPRLSIAYDILNGGTYLNNAPVGGLNLPQGVAYLGFTGTTGAGGGLYERADILSWSFSGAPLAPVCFDGSVGEVLTINGDGGGFLRHVEVSAFEPFSMGMANPTPATVTVPFLIFGTVGAADGSNAFSTGFGDLCFNPFAPTSFVLADSFGALGGLLPATLAPWSVMLPGIPDTGAFSIQGVIANGAGLAITNGTVVEFVPAAAPTVSSVTPASATPGTLITIAGSGFSSLAALDVNGVAITPLSVASDTITFSYPAAVPCDASLTVTNPDGQSATGTLNPTPTVLNGSNSGPAAGGVIYFISGTGFSVGSTVTIGGNPATVTTVTPGAIIGMTPPGTPGATQIVVTTPGGCVISRPYTYL